MERQYLLTPGPTPLPEAVRQAAARPIIHHRTPEFRQIFQAVNTGLKYLFQTENDIFTFAASGTGAMEAALVNLLSAQDKAVVVRSGKFGERWAEIASAYKVKVIPIDVEWGRAVEPKEIERVLSQEQTVKAVFSTLTETSTGVTHDIKAIAEIVKDTEAVLVVDAVSGLGAEDLQTDNWQVDCVVVGSQKGLMLPPGLSFCSISPKAWRLVESSALPKYYFDFQRAKQALDKRDTAFTPPVSLLVALNESLRLIRAEGLSVIFKRHRMLAAATRAALSALGLKLFSSTFCNVLTSAYVPAGIDSTELVKLMRSKYGVSIADGQGRLKGKIIRIAHLGHIHPPDILKGISALAAALKELGYAQEVARGIKAAEQIFRMKE